MKGGRRLKKLEGSKGRPVWLYPNEVQAVKAIPTCYGPRLLLVLRDSGAEVWVEDNPANRSTLQLDEAA